MATKARPRPKREPHPFDKHFSDQWEHKCYFWVNALGEFGRRKGPPSSASDEYLGGSCNVSEAVRRHGRTREEAVAKEFESQMSEQLSPAEYALTKRTLDLQSRNDGRFRIYGGMSDEHRYILLVTEFCGFTDGRELDQLFWQELDRVVERTKAWRHDFDRRRHLDQKWDNTPGHEYDPPEGREERKICGPNDGRPETQLELAWNVHDMPDAEIDRLIETLRAETQPLWQLGGVGVL